MYVFNNRYYKLNQTLLRLLGLWPHEKTKFERFRALCLYMLFVSYVFFQLGQFIVADLNMDVVIPILSDALLTIVFIVNFNVFFFETKKIKRIMEQVTNDWRMVIDVQEIKILKRYARQGKYVTVFFISFLISVFFGSVIMELPDILHLLYPLNKSRAHHLLTMNEYHADRGPQFNLFFLYFAMSMITGSLSLLSIGTLLLLFVLHCCAIFKISSHRIEHTVDERVIECYNKKSIMVERIIKAVELHRSAQKLNKLLLTSFTTHYVIILVLGMLSMTLSLYRFSRAIIRMDNLLELMLTLAYVLVHQFYIFTASYCGQLLYDHANEIFNAIYRSLWYIAPVTIQKLLLFVMQISSKTLPYNVGGVFIILMETFSRVTSLSVSYVMVLYSV